MIEINPRLTLWMGLAAALGVDVAYITYRDLTGLMCPAAPGKRTASSGSIWSKTLRVRSTTSARVVHGCSPEAKVEVILWL